MNYKLWFVLVLQLILAGCSLIHIPPTKTPLPPHGDYGSFKKPKAQKVVLVVLENTDQSMAANQSFLAELKRKGAYFSNYYAITHPSQPNYFALLTGSIQGIDGDEPVTAKLKQKHLGMLLSEKSLTWKAYAEGYESNEKVCKTDDKKPFVVKHVPFLSFCNEQCETPCANVEGFPKPTAEGFIPPEKIKDLPNFSLVIPNLNNDAHDHPVWDADDWLRANFGKLLENPEFKRDVIFIVTFDENGTKPWFYNLDQDNRVYTVMLGDDIQAGEYSAVYNHYDMFRTIANIFGIEPDPKSMDFGIDSDKKDITEKANAAHLIGGIWK
jgi:acid phosphatase